MKKQFENNNYNIMSDILSGRKSKEEMLAFLIQTNKNTSINDLVIYLQAIRDTAQYEVDADEHNLPVVDISGTGGDRQKTANISTMASLVAAATNEVFIYKYGNRSASGISGSMDVLEKLGVNINLDATQIAEIKKQINFVPLFARLVYPGAKNVAEARKELGQPSIFNLLFPLARPIKGNYAFVMGFSNAHDMETASKIIRAEQGRGLLVRGEDGTDEISVSGTGKTDYIYINKDEISRGVIDSQDLFGITTTDISLLQINSVEEAAERFIDVLNPNVVNQKVDAIRHAVLANAAAILAIAQPETSDLKVDLAQAFTLVEAALKNGSSLKLLNLIKETNPYVKENS